MMKTLVSLPYELARLPLAVVDDALSDRLPESRRLTLDRAIGSADKLAGTVLGNRDIAQRGVARLERSAKLAEATRLEEDAAARREQAQAKAAEGRREAARQRKAAQVRATTGLDEADAAEQRGKREAKDRARTTAAEKKAAADKRAAERTTQAERRKERAAGAAESRRKVTSRKAKAELDDARATKQQAAEARADADRLSELAEAKKQARRQG